jgi:hypothetical protein
VTVADRSVSAVVTFAIAIVLLGALLFGLWHVVVGGVVSGNPRAATFGVALTLAGGGLLVAVAAVGRRPGRG